MSADLAALAKFRSGQGHNSSSMRRCSGGVLPYNVASPSPWAEALIPDYNKNAATGAFDGSLPPLTTFTSEHTITGGKCSAEAIAALRSVPSLTKEISLRLRLQPPRSSL